MSCMLLYIPRRICLVASSSALSQCRPGVHVATTSTTIDPQSSNNATFQVPSVELVRPGSVLIPWALNGAKN